MYFVGQVIGFILSIIILALFLFLIWYGYDIFTAVVDGAKSLEPKIYVPLAATLATASIGWFATLYTNNRARERGIEEALRERKIVVYLDFLKTLESIILASNSHLGFKKISKKEIIGRLFSFRTQAVLWGSPGVLKGIDALTKLKTKDPKELHRVLEIIQREMRNDLGLSNTGLEQDFFAKLILKDGNDFDAMSASE